MTDTITLRWVPIHGRARKVRFEPDGRAWRRTEFELRESRWRQIGTERVAIVAVASSATRAHDVDLEEGARDE